MLHEVQVGIAHCVLGGKKVGVDPVLVYQLMMGDSSDADARLSTSLFSLSACMYELFQDGAFIVVTSS